MMRLKRRAAAPSLRTGAQVVAGNANWNTQVFGTWSDYFEVRDWPLAEGRVFESGEIAGSGKVAIVGQTVAEHLFGGADPIDQTIRIRTVPLVVIGLLASKGQSPGGSDLDDVIHRLQLDLYVDQVQLRRLKKRKLLLKDQIARLESQLIPDLNA